jgi:hypothetical protein
MDGKFQNEQSIENKFIEWQSAVLINKTSWQGNNIHIDEFDGMSNLKRSEWAEKALSLLCDFSRLLISENMVLFLHIELKESSRPTFPRILTLPFLQKNVHEFSPPSFHYTSIEYFESYYVKQCQEFASVNLSFKVLNPNCKLIYYGRPFWDVRENLFSRDIYVFVVRQS